MEAAQARLEAAEAEQEIADEDDGDDSSAQEMADAARQLAIAQGTRAIAKSLKSIDRIVTAAEQERSDRESRGLPVEEIKTARTFTRDLYQDNRDFKQAVNQLRDGARQIEDRGMRVRILADHWKQHPDIGWLETSVDLLIGA